jgi:hypothetical protein
MAQERVTAPLPTPTMPAAPRSGDRSMLVLEYATAAIAVAAAVLLAVAH